VSEKRMLKRRSKEKYKITNLELLHFYEVDTKVKQSLYRPGETLSFPGG
jgi:hypothetical protein